MSINHPPANIYKNKSAGEIYQTIKDKNIITGMADSSVIEGCECFTYVHLHTDDGMLDSFDSHKISLSQPYFAFSCIWENGSTTLLQKYNGFWLANKLVVGETYILNAYDEHALVPDNIAESYISDLIAGEDCDTFTQWNNKWEKLADFQRESPIVAVLNYIKG